MRCVKWMHGNAKMARTMNHELSEWWCGPLASPMLNGANPLRCPGGPPNVTIPRGIKVLDAPVRGVEATFEGKKRGGGDDKKDPELGDVASEGGDWLDVGLGPEVLEVREDDGEIPLLLSRLRMVGGMATRPVMPGYSSARRVWKLSCGRWW